VQQLSRKPRKPSGVTGPYKLSGEGVEHNAYQLPPDKEEQEEVLARVFLRCLSASEKASLGILRVELDEAYEMLDENDHDFLIKGDGKNWKVQITELILIDEFCGNYEDGVREYDVGFLADKFIDRVVGKSQRYGLLDNREEDKTILLVFTGDEKFLLSDSTKILINIELRKIKHGFGRVYYMPLMDGETGFPSLLYPGKIPPKLTNTQIKNIRENKVHNLDIGGG